jgi:hypothetical protein
MTLVGESVCDSKTVSSVPRDVQQSPKPTERRLDQEAVSRMDDEGGSTHPAANSPKPEEKVVPDS